MNISLDHLVHFIAGSPQEILEILEKKGIRAAAGGSHEKWGTYNSLLYTSSSYIEFLAIQHEEIAEVSDNPLIVQLRNGLKIGEGIGQICFRTDDIHKLQNDLNEQNIKTLPIFEGSRKRSDGKLIQWKMLFMADTNDYLPYPFFIEWEESDEARYAELKAAGFVDPSLENSHIVLIEWPVTDYKKAAASWNPLFRDYMRMDDSSQRLVITIGSTEIHFVSQNQSQSALHHNSCRIQLNPRLKNGPMCLKGAMYE